MSEHEQRDSEQDIDPALLPDDEAASQFVHGLIEHIRRDDSGTQGARISRLMSAIRAEGSGSGVGDSGAAVPVVRRQRLRLVAMVAAPLATAAAVVLAFFVLMVPTERTALAVVQQTLDASRSIGDRTYLVQAMMRKGPDATGDTPHEIGRLYLDDGERVVVDARMKRGGRVVIGRSPDDAWTVSPDNEVLRYDGPMRAPKWVEFSTSTLPVDSVDGLLATLPSEYELALEGSETLDGVPCTKVVAKLKSDTARHRPNQVIAWIDDRESFLRRIELRWPERPDWQEMRRERLERFRAIERSDDGASPGAEARRGGPRGHAGGPREHGPDGGRRHADRAHDRRVGDDRHRERGSHDGPRDGPHDGARERRRRGPEGARGHRFIDGPPKFARGHHAPPPSAIIFTLESRETLAPGWFQPEAHLERGDQPAG